MAQLTVRNVGAMVSLINADASCGFASPAVLGAPTVEGAVGGPGALTFTATSCVIDLGTQGAVGGRDCNGKAGTTRGKLTISATRRVEGTLTGNPQSPIIPATADAVTITLTRAEFENFEARSPGSENVLTMVSGSLSAVVKPRLAVSASSGACAVATPNVTFSDIVYSNANLHLTTADNSFDVPVPTSDFDAQNGINGTKENALEGTITVFESPVTLATVLDPAYDAEAFVAGYACHPDLTTPISFQCADLNGLLANGAARLSAKMQGTITSLIESNTTCGFSSPAVLGAGDPEGTPGEDGSITFTVTNCELSFPTLVELPANCSGVSTTVQGSVTVSGTKTVSGRFTANPAQPIVPATSQPAEFSLTSVIGVDGFRVGSTGDINALEATAGTLVGTTRPKVFVGSTTGVCSVSSPHTDMTLAWADADLTITSSTGTLDLNGVSSVLAATNGVTAAGTNEISGTVTVGTTAYPVTSALDPSYDAEAFDASWQCGATLDALTASPNSECGVALMQTIGGGTAALTMRTLGTVTSIVDANTSCGFSSPAVGGTPTFEGGDVGDDGVTATFTLGGSGCTVAIPVETVVSTNCLGHTTSVTGTVVVTGTKKVTGFRTGSPSQPIVPTGFKPAQFDLTLTFTDFVVKSSASTAFLTIHGGALAGTVQPRTALDPATGACSVATPNVSFSNVVWTNGEVTLNSSGSNFNASVATSALAAQNGTDGTTTNSLSGALTLDMVPLTGIQAPLDRAYEQGAFDATYACAGAIVVPDAACSFRQALGGAAARLLAGSVALATSAGSHPSLGNCFPPDTITGDLGSGGTGTSAASSCNVTVTADTTLASECPATGGVSKAGGTFVLNGTKNTTGVVVDTTEPADGTADAVVPLNQTAITYQNMTYAMTGWKTEKLLGTASTGAITVSGTLAVETFTPVLAEADDDNDDIGEGVFTKRSPIFDVAGLTSSSATAQLLLQGKRFNVTLTAVDLDLVVGAYGGRANSVGGLLVVDGEPVVVPAGSPLQTTPAFTQQGLDDAYSCDPTLILVPAN